MNTTARTASQTAPTQFALDAPFVLRQGELMRVAPASNPTLSTTGPWLLKVEAGAVWATWPGCGDDVFLVAGQQVEVPAGVPALVEVEPRLLPGAALLRLARSQRPARPARGWKAAWLAPTRLA